ncbi:MAG: metabolite traffic protein EboE [Rhodospirillales bacterium]|nr:metabolite traffic protein EboE [Rhodospirillales bacterium]
MRLTAGAGEHLTYCTNVHPGETWPQVRACLDRDVPAVRDRIEVDHGASWRGAFGVGLRLSAACAEALSAPDAFAELQDCLARHRLYVFTLNGFPFGDFHGRPVKAQVYRPDWQEEARVVYTRNLAEVLARLLPDDQPFGSISTVPGAIRPRGSTNAAIERIADNLLRGVAHLIDIERRSGRRLILALEPEPYCLLETIAEAIAFFEAHVLCSAALARLGTLAGLAPAAAEAALRRHLGVCLDTCHAAVEFEDPAAILDDLRGAGITIGKVQLSAGLRIPAMTPDLVPALARFDDSVYLHQVVERDAHGLNRYGDLDDALSAFAGRAHAPTPPEWRVHFHVPIFRPDLGPFASTQPFVADILDQHRLRPVSLHLEVETYTWGVLPDAFRTTDLPGAIARELSWVMSRIGS